MPRSIHKMWRSIGKGVLFKTFDVRGFEKYSFSYRTSQICFSRRLTSIFMHIICTWNSTPTFWENISNISKSHINLLLFKAFSNVSRNSLHVKLPGSISRTKEKNEKCKFYDPWKEGMFQDVYVNVQVPELCLHHLETCLFSLDRHK